MLSQFVFLALIDIEGFKRGSSLESSLSMQKLK